MKQLIALLYLLLTTGITFAATQSAPGDTANVVNKFELSDTHLHLKIGETHQLSVRVDPEELADRVR